MKLTNKTYDTLNALHRGALILAELIAIASLIVAALSEQGVVIPSIATTIIAVTQAVIGRVLVISSKTYWEENGGTDE